MTRRVLQLMITLCLCISLGGCTQTRRTRIAYTVYPIGYILSRLTTKDVPYQSIQENSYAMVQNATITADYENRLNKAVVLFHIGNLEPYYQVFESSIENIGVHTIDLSKGNAVYEYGRYESYEDDNGNTIYETVPYYNGVAFEHIDLPRQDLYLWLDPIAMLSMAKEICQWLENRYPSSKNVIHENYVSLQNDLIALDAQYQVLKAHSGLSIVTMSPSFGCWQKSYGISVYPVVQSMYGVLPDEKQIQEIEKTIIENNVRYIVFESNMNEEMTELFYRIQSDCSLTRIELSNLSCLSENEELEGKDYLSLMYQNLSVMLNTISDHQEENE
ncbi:MAG TPA: hypothetical protein DCW34_07530 [Erysipelotrichaceae bacterium]|nr:hypothetical protein [Erysipelotrichaceae bacterium]